MGTPMRARLMKSTLAQKVTKLFSTLLPLLLASLVFFHSQNGQTQRTHPTVKPSSETACKRDDLWCGVDITALKPGPSGTGNKPYASLAKRLNSQEVVSSDESESAVSLYHKGFPSKQAAVDLFQDINGTHWFSIWPTLPGKLPTLSSVGSAGLYADPRMLWFVKIMGGRQNLAGKSVFESGPLECHHSFFLHAHGVARVDAVEGNVGCYIRCLITKEVLKVSSLNVFFGDFITFMKLAQKQKSRTIEEGLLLKYDIALFNGVLYHMADPVRVIAHLATISDVIVCWTQYWNEEEPHAIQSRAAYVSEVVTIDDMPGLGPFTTTYHKHYYDIFNKAHMGGQEPFANWQTNHEQFRTLKWAGYKFYSVLPDPQPCVHPNGCQHNFAASKKPQQDGPDWKWLAL